MRTVMFARFVVMILLAIVLSFSGPTGSSRTNNGTRSLPQSAGAPDPIASASTYYLVRRDLRRCASPMCGGYFVRRVNATSTPCANGKVAPECYVAEINWNQPPPDDVANLLLRGDITGERHASFGLLGRFNVSEVWQAVGGNATSEDFYRVRDRGVRCIAAPCPTHHEARLNSAAGADIAGVDLARTHADESKINEAFKALTGTDGIIVTGWHEPVRGPAGKSQQLAVARFYLRHGGSRQASGRCMKTGCSNQICSDHAVTTTCEWREEYACYRNAKCERQADGNCGFTQTPELKACLGKK